MEEKEILVRAWLVKADKETINKVKDKVAHIDARYVRIDDIDAVPLDEEVLFYVTAEADTDWADIEDPYSSSGTRGGKVYGYEAAKAEIKTFMDTLYLNDLIVDWDYENSLPDGYEVMPA